MKKNDQQLLRQLANFISIGGLGKPGKNQTKTVEALAGKRSLASLIPSMSTAVPSQLANAASLNISAVQFLIVSDEGEIPLNLTGKEKMKKIEQP